MFTPKGVQYFKYDNALFLAIKMLFFLNIAASLKACRKTTSPAQTSVAWRAGGAAGF